MKIKKGFIVREVGGENIVVPVGKMGKDFHGMIKLNETGRFLWEQFTKDITEEDAVKALLAEYDVSEECAKEDVHKFAEILRENKFVEEKC